MKKNLLKVFAVGAAIMISLSANAIEKLAKKSTYVGQITTLDALKNADAFMLVNAAGQALYIPSNWDIKVAAAATVVTGEAFYYKHVEDANGSLLQVLDSKKAPKLISWVDSSPYSKTATFVNRQPAGNNVIFGLGLAGRYGQDGANLALWTITCTDELFYFENVGVAGSYLSDNGTAACPADAPVGLKAYASCEALYTESEVLAKKDELIAAAPQTEAALEGISDVQALGDAINAQITLLEGGDFTSFMGTTFEGASGSCAWGVEKYVEGGVAEGDVLTQTITGLANGVYEIKFYASANVARNLDVAEFAGDGIAYVFANATEKNVTVNTESAIADQEIYSQTLKVKVTDGTLKYGIANRKAGGQWYVIKPISLKYLSGFPETIEYTLNADIYIYDNATSESVAMKTLDDQPVTIAWTDDACDATIPAVAIGAYSISGVTLKGIEVEQNDYSMGNEPMYETSLWYQEVNPEITFSTPEGDVKPSLIRLDGVLTRGEMFGMNMDDLKIKVTLTFDEYTVIIAFLLPDGNLDNLDLPTAIEKVETTTAKAAKFMQNGKLVIVKNGKTYNAAGQLVK